MPLLLWLLIQLAALLLAVTQTPLSARFPQPAERLAIHEMVAVQIAASALLFPLLMRNGRTALMVIATSWPFIQLAGFLSIAPAGRIFAAGLFVTLWLGILTSWRFALRSHRLQLIGIAVAASLALGGVALWYLQVEFGPAEGVDWAWHGLFGPIMAGLAQLEQERIHAGAWIAAGVLLLAGIGAAALRRPSPGDRDNRQT